MSQFDETLRNLMKPEPLSKLCQYPTSACRGNGPLLLPPEEELDELDEDDDELDDELLELELPLQLAAAAPGPVTCR